jgi:hypothetical protein
MNPGFRLLAAVGLLVASAAFALPQEEAPAPRLVVVVCIDQMTPEQLERLRPWLTGGLARFAEEGLRFRSAAHRHGVTETAPGHASLVTGLDPLRHGLVSNAWWLPDSKPSSYCVSDPDVVALTDRGPRADDRYRAGRCSPRNLRAPGLGDWIKRADARSIACSIGLKDRSAVAMGGHRPDVCLWWDRVRGGFQSSSWYGEALPDWAAEWNAGWVERLTGGAFAAGWTSGLPERFEGSGTAPDDRPGESGPGGRRTFPYPLPKASDPPTDAELDRLADVVFATPAGDEFVLDIARRAVEALGLGADLHPDLLCLALSDCDTVGHAFGPLSCEVTDLLLRADRRLGELFQLLDERVGREGWVAVLSADHGVLELPEALAERGIGAVRVPGSALRDAVKAARKRMEERFGSDFYLAHGARGVRLSERAIAAAGLSAREVRREVAEALMQAGASWLERVWTWDELEAAARGDVPAPGWLAVEARSFDRERTSDLTLLPRPWHLVGKSTGTSHGSPYPYDRAVPLVFLGRGFPRGESWRESAPVDVVPTVMGRLGLPAPPGLDGRNLVP